jgi:hypothetical protein
MIYQNESSTATLPLSALDKSRAVRERIEDGARMSDNCFLCARIGWLARSGFGGTLDCE